MGAGSLTPVGPSLEEAVDGYVAAWNEGDPVVREGLLARSVTDDFEFAGPTGTLHGREALEGLIVALRSRMAGAKVARLGPVEEGRFPWAILDAGGATVLGGLDEVEVADDGRLRRISVAAGTPSG